MGTNNVRTLSAIRGHVSAVVSRVLCQIALCWPFGDTREQFLDRITRGETARLAMIPDAAQQLLFMLDRDTQLTRVLSLPPGFFLRRFLGGQSFDEFLERLVHLVGDSLASVPAWDCAALIAVFDEQYHQRLGVPAGWLSARLTDAVVDRLQGA